MLKALPSVDEVLKREQVQELASKRPRWAVKEAVRQEIEERRRTLLSGTKLELDQLSIDTASIETRMDEFLKPALRPVINATGVVVHTNLGRSPLPRRAIEKIIAISTSYSNLEYNLVKGRRGSRHDHLRGLASAVCGAEDAVIVNNNAAAVLLTVSALAAHREVIVSRGEAVEIGGGFRIPEVIIQGGARLKEVGTTNRTRISDYSEAIGPDTAALLKVHRSNFDVVGFTEEVDYGELAGLSRSTGVPVIADLGSGAMIDRYGPGLTGEPVVRDTLKAGADLVCFSGDKLFGGPQAGIILGKGELVERIRKHPFMRAFRPCKLTLTALEATFELWRDGLTEEIPLVKMLSRSPEVEKRRAGRLRRLIKAMSPSWTVEIQAVAGRAGGGSMPLRSAPGWAVALRHQGFGADDVEAFLRGGEPPVIGRIIDEQVILDTRTLSKGQEQLLIDRLKQVTKQLDSDNDSTSRRDSTSATK